MRDVGVGDRLGAYEILGLLGRGRRSTVYVARHRPLGTLNALRVFGPDPADTAWFERHRSRYAALAEVAHEHLVCVLAVGVADGLGCVGLTLARGPGLATLVKDGPLRHRQVAQIVDQLAAALDALHGAGVVHGDLGPTAVLFDGDPGVKLTPVLLADPDPGAATGAAADAAYLAPERIGGSPASRATDVYGLGCLLYHGLTGRPPYASDSESSVLQAHLAARPPSLREAGVSAPWAAAVEEVIARAMAKYPRDRYDSCRELAAAAGRALSAPVRAAEPRPAPSPAAPSPAAPAPAAAGLDEPTRPAPALAEPRVDLSQVERAGDLPAATRPGAERDWESLFDEQPPLSATRPEADPFRAFRPPPPGAAPGPPPSPLGDSDEWLFRELESVEAPAAPPPSPSAPAPHPPAPQAPMPTADAGSGQDDGATVDLEWTAAATADARGLAEALGQVLAVPTGVGDGRGELADIAVFAPDRADPGSRFRVEVLADHLSDAALVRALSADSGIDVDADADTVRTLASVVADGTTLHLDLALDGLVIERPVARIVWRRTAEAVSFDVTVPGDRPPGEVWGTLGVSQNTVPIGHVRFAVTVVDQGAGARAELRPAGAQAARYRRAYASYAEADREAVRARARLLAGVGIDLVPPLDAGADPADAAVDQLATADLFLLFWSESAAESDSVREEVRRALDQRAVEQRDGAEGRPRIHTVLLGPPPSAPPWPELERVPFGDLSRVVLSATA